MFVLELAALFHDLYEQVFLCVLMYDANSPAVPSTPEVTTAPSWLCSSKAVKKLFHLVKLNTLQRLSRMCRTVRRSSE